MRITHKYIPFNRLMLSVVRDIEITKYPKIQIDSSACSLCGLCVKKCPDNNLVLIDGRIQVKDDRGCLHCLRCINHCPSNAFTFGKLTEGENRYTLHIRNQLFEKAVSGYREKYWPDIHNVVKLWRKNTFQYWLQYRKNPR